MAFLTIDDYKAKVKDDVMVILTRNDESVRTIAEGYAQAEMEGYLSARYDTTAIFNATGSDRDPIVILYMVEIALYHLFDAISNRKIPPKIETRYHKATEWLMKVQEGDINPPRLPVPTDNSKDFIRFGNNKKRNSHY
jgi:phage gp36-like protein